MRNNLFTLGKIATLAIAIATTVVACKDKEEPQNPPTPPTPPSSEATFNVLYRVHTGTPDSSASVSTCSCRLPRNSIPS